MILTLPSPLLVLEASTSAGSVALIADGALVGQRDVQMGPAREDALLPAISDLLHTSRVRTRDVRAVLCGSGPGSFTSLRIAASLAKGVVVANNASLFAVPSFLLALAPLLAEPGQYLLHSDALRGERYVLGVTVNTDSTFAISRIISRVTLDQVAGIAADTLATAVAIGASRIESSELTLQPVAANALSIAAYLNVVSAVNVATWEPEYGRLAEAQVKWETAHGHGLPTV